MDTSVVTINGLTKHYKKFSLGPLHFQVEQGMAVALVGGNGSGKSTFFRLLMNLLKADDGTILFFSKELNENEVEIKKRVGYVGDLLEPFHYLTIRELAELVSRWYPNWDEQGYRELLMRYRIDESVKYGKCSKGMKKKAEFIFSICHRPNLLLLDEPTAGVDIVSQRKMKEDLLAFMENEENSLIIATHTIEEVKQLCDVITILDDGKIIYTFEKDEVYEKWARLWLSQLSETVEKHPNVIQVEQTPAQLVTNDLAKVEELIKKEQIEITHLQKLTLEEVLEHVIQ